MEPKNKRRHNRKKRYHPFSWMLSPLYFVGLFIYIELVFHIREFGNVSAPFPVLFAIPAGLLTGFFCDLFSEKIARWLRYGVSALFMVLCAVQMVYFHSFQSFMSFSQVGMGGDVFTNFLSAILLAIWECLIPILLVFLPLVGLYFIHKRISPKRRFNAARTCMTMAICLFSYLGVILCLPLAGTGDHSAYANFHSNWVLDLSMEKLGLLSTTGFDLRYYMFGENDIASGGNGDTLVNVTVPVQDEETEPTAGPEGPVEYGYNVIEGLDFAAMAKSEQNSSVKKICEYLASLEPTKKNEYTGMFADYNLILITGEAFSAAAIDPELTPTLYKLANSGFNFTNFWTTYPSNTTNGEYSNLTGLIPDISKPKSDGSFVYSVKNTMNMNIANWFNAQGLTSRAYHNHTAGYYKRNKTHPNIGYSVFKGKGEIGGLTGWPESDLVMMQKTVDEYIGDERFHTYYMTVSGHHNYRFGYNTMADKNKSAVKDLAMSEGPKAYIATHIELDKALEHLITRLEEAGKLDKTVIVLAPDHYPYGLTDSEWKELIGHKIGYGGMERYRNELIIWNSAMETVIVDKPCSQVDVLPTILNLFGFTYDSRLYSGMDILSDSYGLAMMANQSFVTDKIVYNSRYEKVYYLDENWEMPDGYLEAYIQIVKNRFSIASNILNQDFYAKLPQDVIRAAQAIPGKKPGE